MTTIADRIAAQVRRPTITMRLSGRRCTRVLRARVSQAYGSSGISGGTVVLRQPPIDPAEGMAITWTWGYDGYEVPGFTGYVTRITDNSYPDTWELEVQDVLWLAQREQRPIATSPLNNVDATDAITYILETYAGLTRIDLPNIEIGGSTWTLGQLTPISWDRTTALAACQEIAATAGYWLYADAGGTVRATLIERRPSDSPFRTFQRGVDLLMQGAPQRVRDGNQVKNRWTVRGASTGVEGAQLYDTFLATHALYPGVVADGEFSSFLLEYIADVTAVASRLTGLWNRKPNIVRYRVKADPRLRCGATVAIKDSGISYTSAQPFFLYALDTEYDGASGRFDQQITLDGGTGSAGYTTIPNPVAVIAVRVLERETVNGDAITVFEVDGSGSHSLSGGEIVSYAWTLTDTPYSSSATSATTEKATFIVADTEAPFTVSLTVTDTSSKTGTATVDIPLSGDVVDSAREAYHAAGGAAWSYTPDGGATWRDDVRTCTIVAEGAGVRDDAPATDTGAYGALATSSAQVRQTLDGLASASTLLSTASGAVTALHVNARNASRAWRAVGTALQRSLDGGTTWASWGTLPASVACIIEDPALDNSVFVLAGANAYNTYRADGTSPGSTWSTLYAGPSGATARWMVRSDDGATTWIGYTGTFTGSPVQRVEGGVSATGITGECRALALVQTDPGNPVLVAVDAASPPKTWYGPASTGALTAGPTLPSGSTAQHATASRLAPVVYIADFDSVSAGVTGAIRKLVLGQATPALLPARLGPAGRQYHMVQLAGSGAALNAEILLAPWGATGAGDKIWRHVPGTGWVGITPPSAGKYWYYITASPFTPSSWLVMGNSTGTNYERMAVDAGGVVRMADTTTHPLWYTDDNGATWTAISLTSPDAGPLAASADMALIRVEWLRQGNGWALIRQKPTSILKTTVWRGAGSTASAPATDSSDTTGALALASAQDDDLVIAGPKMQYQTSGGTFTVPSGTGGLDVAQGDVIPGGRGAVFVGRVTQDLYATSDYRAAQPTLKLAGTWGTLAAMADGTVLTPGATGVYRITDPTGSPVATLEAGAGVGVAWGVLRPDRQTRTQVATRSGATVLVYTGSDWATLAIPSDASDATLGPRLEILTRA